MWNRPPENPGPRWGQAGEGGCSSESWLCTAARQGGRSRRGRMEDTASWGWGWGQNITSGSVGELRLLVRFFSLSWMFEIPRLGSSD